MVLKETKFYELCLYPFHIFLKLTKFYLCEVVALGLCHEADVIQALIMPRLSSNAHNLFSWKVDDNNI